MTQTLTNTPNSKRIKTVNVKCGNSSK